MHSIEIFLTRQICSKSSGGKTAAFYTEGSMKAFVQRNNIFRLNQGQKCPESMIYQSNMTQYDKVDFLVIMNPFVLIIER